MKKILLAAAVAALFSYNAQAEVMKIALAGGTTVTYNIDEIQEITFEEAADANTIAGTYSGTQSVSVGGMYTYTADIAVTIAENADNTINVTFPTYGLTGTVMGDLTLSEITIPNIPYDEAKKAYYLNYSALGYTQHFKAVQGGATTMDKDYVLGETSEITVEKTDAGVKIVNPFKLGAMPFPLTATFEGTK